MLLTSFNLHPPRHTTQPRELICVTSSKAEATELEAQISERVSRVFDFLRDHRYDPTEYYGEQDYLKEIPDPCTEPLAVLEELTQIIQAFGNASRTKFLILS